MELVIIKSFYFKKTYIWFCDNFLKVNIVGGSETSLDKINKGTNSPKDNDNTNHDQKRLVDK